MAERARGWLIAFEGIDGASQCLVPVIAEGREFRKIRARSHDGRIVVFQCNWIGKHSGQPEILLYLRNELPAQFPSRAVHWKLRSTITTSNSEMAATTLVRMKRASVRLQPSPHLSRVHVGASVHRFQSRRPCRRLSASLFS